MHALLFIALLALVGIVGQMIYNRASDRARIAALETRVTMLGITLNRLIEHTGYDPATD